MEYDNDGGHYASEAFDGPGRGRVTSGGREHRRSVARRVGYSHQPVRQPWWEVDLEATYPLRDVEVWNRTDCCSERLSRYYVLVSESPITADTLDEALAQNGVHAFYQEETAGSPTEVPVNVDGRYVRVWLTSPSDPLSLAEVMVYGPQE